MATTDGFDAAIAEIKAINETNRENRSIDRQESETEYIEQLASTGAICEVFGHRWEGLAPDANTERRSCALCPKEQVGMNWGMVWEDVE